MPNNNTSNGICKPQARDAVGKGMFRCVQIIATYQKTRTKVIFKKTS